MISDLILLSVYIGMDSYLPSSPILHLSVFWHLSGGGAVSEIYWYLCLNPFSQSLALKLIYPSLDFTASE